MNRKGFTFIELVTVFSIIAVLMAILFPVFAKARNKANQASCLRNLESIATALRIYGTEHYGHLPPADNDLTPLLGKDLPDPAALLCPSASNPLPRTYPPPLPEQMTSGGRPSDYVYRGGLCDDDNPLLIVAADRNPDLHNDGANYLFLDGHGKWLKDYDEPGQSSGDESSRPDLGLMGWQEIRGLRGPAAETTPTPVGPPGGPE